MFRMNMKKCLLVWKMAAFLYFSGQKLKTFEWNKETELMTGCYQCSHKQQLFITFYNPTVKCFHYHRAFNSSLNITSIPDCLSVSMCEGEKQRHGGVKCVGQGRKSADVLHSPPINHVQLTICWRHRKIRGDKYKSGSNTTVGDPKPLTLTIG